VRWVLFLHVLSDALTTEHSSSTRPRMLLSWRTLFRVSLNRAGETNCVLKEAESDDTSWNSRPAQENIKQKTKRANCLLNLPSKQGRPKQINKHYCDDVRVHAHIIYMTHVNVKFNFVLTAWMHCAAGGVHIG
jgi:hypothetical protein